MNMASRMLYLFLVALSITLSSAANEISNGITTPTTSSPTNVPQGTAKSLSQLALAVARSTYLPIDRFSQNGSIMENPSYYGKRWVRCPKRKPEMQAGLCYKPCTYDKSSWAFANGVGPVCWGCPKSHPIEQGALCYKECPDHKPKGRMFLCFGDCPSDYRNDGLTCFRDARLRAADTSDCPWYDKCGLTFSRGCSKCPAGYKNDGCICRQNPHVTVRPRYHRGIGVPMKSYSRGIGILPNFLRYDPTSEREACQTKDWVGTAFVKENTEVVKLVNARQKITVFGFRGTEITSVADWLANLDFHPDEFVVNSTLLRAHGGFKNRYENIATWFEKEYLNTSEDHLILLTGHNQGGALASIAAVFAAGKLARAPNAVITWGSPRIGADDFRKFYRKHVGCDVTINYVTKGDVVALLPSALLYGYSHVCDVMKLGPSNANFIRAHSLYTGYGEGLEREFGDAKEIQSGCDASMAIEKRVPEDILVSENTLAYYQ